MCPLGLLFLLLLLSPCTGCVFCKQSYWHLQERFEKLCTDYKAAERSDNCTRHRGRYSFNPYGIDESNLYFITQKTHRVFRVLEITRDRLGIAAYWDWLHEVKLPEYTHAALCPPLCRETAHVYNCTLCKIRRMSCWSLETCYPADKVELYTAVVIVEYCCMVCVILGIVVYCCMYLREKKSGDRAVDRVALLLDD
ncbi:sperm-egg fusion protein TMEM95 [Pseudophryne corroboree]|uniref:sperm-egg fusion protein TMEM95 n=1 Tax=Pseudophryne corroboree TaxID=495146 RepID=UPI003081490B